MKARMWIFPQPVQTHRKKNNAGLSPSTAQSRRAAESEGGTISGWSEKFSRRAEEGAEARSDSLRAGGARSEAPHGAGARRGACARGRITYDGTNCIHHQSIKIAKIIIIEDLDSSISTVSKQNFAITRSLSSILLALRNYSNAISRSLQFFAFLKFSSFIACKSSTIHFSSQLFNYLQKFCYFQKDFPKHFADFPRISISRKSVDQVD